MEVGGREIGMRSFLKAEVFYRCLLVGTVCYFLFIPSPTVKMVAFFVAVWCGAWWLFQLVFGQALERACAGRGAYRLGSVLKVLARIEREVLRRGPPS